MLNRAMDKNKKSEYNYYKSTFIPSVKNASFPLQITQVFGLFIKTINCTQYR